jgi:hypothetical protein
MTEYVTRSDFKPTDIVVVEPKGRNPKWAYVAEWKGKKSVHLREVYQDENEAWCPGKGISFAIGTDAANRVAIAFGLTSAMPEIAAKPATKTPAKKAA